VSPGPSAHIGQIKLIGDTSYLLLKPEEDAHFHPGESSHSRNNFASAVDLLRKKVPKQSRYTAQDIHVDRAYICDRNTVDYTLHIEPGPIVQMRLRAPKTALRAQGAHTVYEEKRCGGRPSQRRPLNLVDYSPERGFFDAKVPGHRRSRIPTGRSLHKSFTT